MKIAHISDLHGEVNLSRIKKLDCPEADVLILNGDIGTMDSSQSLRWVLEHFQDKYENIILVAGNHEYWKSGSLAEVNDRINRLVKGFPSVIFLEREFVTIKGQRFAGLTGWYPMTVHAQMHASSFPDFKYIRGLYNDLEFYHDEAVSFVGKIEKTDILITHHLPHYTFVANEFKGSSYNCFFVSSLLDTMKEWPSHWLFGHTHTVCDREINETRFLCNPLGYPREIAKRPNTAIKVFEV